MPDRPPRPDLAPVSDPGLRVVIAQPVGSWPSRLEALMAGHPRITVTARAFTADDAVEAIRGMRFRKGVAALVGLHLTGERDGFWLIRAIRQRFPSVRVVAFHSHADEETLERAFLAGADGYIDVDADAQTVFDALQRVEGGQVVVVHQPERPSVEGSADPRLEPEPPLLPEAESRPEPASAAQTESEHALGPESEPEPVLEPEPIAARSPAAQAGVEWPVAPAKVRMEREWWRGHDPFGRRRPVRQEPRQAEPPPKAVESTDRPQPARDEEEDRTAAAGRVVSLFSLKGESGKTFLAANLALALAHRTGGDTAVLDLDRRSEAAGVLTVFGCPDDPRSPDLTDLVEAGRGDLARLGRPVANRVRVFASGAKDGVGALGAETVTRLIGALRAAFANVVIDTPPGNSDGLRAALRISDRVCLVTGPDSTGTGQLARAMRAMTNLGITRDRVIVVANQAEGKPDDGIDHHAGPVADERIPSSSAVPTSIRDGKPIYLSKPKSVVSKGIERLAVRMLQDG